MGENIKLLFCFLYYASFLNSIYTHKLTTIILFGMFRALLTSSSNVHINEWIFLGFFTGVHKIFIQMKNAGKGCEKQWHWMKWAWLDALAGDKVQSCSDSLQNVRACNWFENICVLTVHAILPLTFDVITAYLHTHRNLLL